MHIISMAGAYQNAICVRLFAIFKILLTEFHVVIHKAIWGFHRYEVLNSAKKINASWPGNKETLKHNSIKRHFVFNDLSLVQLLRESLVRVLLSD